MNDKSTPKKTDAKHLIDKTKSGGAVAKYTSFGGIMKAKTGGSLPRGLKVKVDGDNVIFSTAKLGTVATIPVAEFATGELKRHGFSFAK